YAPGFEKPPEPLVAALALGIGGLAPGAIYAAAPLAAPSPSSVPATIGLTRQPGWRMTVATSPKNRFPAPPIPDPDSAPADRRPQGSGVPDLLPHLRIAASAHLDARRVARRGRPAQRAGPGRQLGWAYFFGRRATGRRAGLDQYRDGVRLPSAAASQ